MTKNEISRRQLAKFGLSMATAASITSLPGLHVVSKAHAQELFADKSTDNFELALASSLTKAYSFLDAMMDAYAQGATARLSQSYADQQGLQSTAFVYDNSVAINAYLLRGRTEDIARAIVLGQALLHAQQVDSIGDGRVRQAYFVDQPDAQGVFVRPALFPFFFLGSAVGDMAWTGVGLAQLFHLTGDRQFLNGAVKLGQWIVSNTLDTRGAGGFNFGVDNSNSKLLFKSTEHNIDCVALFTMLAKLTGDGGWLAQAEHARTFVHAMFNSADGGFFFTGTTGDGVTINSSNVPEDVQTWSFLATLDESHAPSIDWAKTNLATTDTPQTIQSRLTGNNKLSGVTFASQSLRALAPSDQFSAVPSPNAVWFEGTGHLAAALLARRLPARRDLPGFHGDLDTARSLLDNIRTSQETLAKGQTVGGKALPDGEGVVAASSVLNTGFGFSFNPNRHIAATSWFALAGQAGNPFQLGLRTDGHDKD